MTNKKERAGIFFLFLTIIMRSKFIEGTDGRCDMFIFKKNLAGSFISRMSIESVHESTRQRLQTPSTRRIFVVNNDFDMDRFGLPGAIESFEDVTEVKNCNQQDIPMRSLKQMVIKKPNESVTEVRILIIHFNSNVN